MLIQCLHLAYCKSQPARCLEAKGNWHRLLEQCPPCHKRLAMIFSKGSACHAHLEQFGYQQVKPVAHLKHQGGIDCILARGSPMHVLLRLSPYTGREHAYQGNRGSSGQRSFMVERCDIEQLHLASGSNSGCRFVWDDSGTGLRGSERRFKCEHGLYMSLRREDSRHTRHAEEGYITRFCHTAFLAQTLKNTVSPSPCRMISKR